MPVFISYSHDDSDFVELLAENLVKNKARVWIDKWELSVGESILDRVQNAIQESSALLVVLSSASVKSQWCKKEISAGLIRELEEKKVFVLPALKETCEIPIFLKEKMYADFTKNYDKGLNSVLEAIAKISNENQGRIYNPEFHVDWSIDWGNFDGLFRMRFTLIEQIKSYPYTVLTEVVVNCNKSATDRYNAYMEAGLDWIGRSLITKSLEFVPNKDDYQVILEDQMPQIQNFRMDDSKSDKSYSVTISCRRLGEDTGKDTLIDIGKYIDDIRVYLKEITREPTPSELSKLNKLLRELP